MVDIQLGYLSTCSLIKVDSATFLCCLFERLWYNWQITDVGIQHIAANCPQLISLNLHSCTVSAQFHPVNCSLIACAYCFVT